MTRKIICILKMLPILISLSIIAGFCLTKNPIGVFVIVVSTSLIILAYFCQLFEEGWKELMIIMVLSKENNL
jgi:hypothetical protein